MIRYRYTGCSGCHVDPSGAGPLTHYGRVIGDTLLAPPLSDAEEPSTGPLFGAVKTPDWLNVGFDGRALWLRSKAGWGGVNTGSVPMTRRLIWMQADASAAIDVSSFIAVGSIGYAPEGALGAALTREVEGNLVSRQHWVGYRFESPGLTLRAGRMHLPFGIRTLEHTLWARNLTRTDINDDQQYGLALAFSREMIRGEVMAIAGNFQLRPDDYRERGYSAFIEAAVFDQLAVGASSLITHRDLDPTTFAETWRHAHGAFARWVTPWEALVLQGEWDYLLSSSREHYYWRGNAAFLQADLEFSPGMHVQAIVEGNKVGSRRRFWGHSGWLSYWWFFMPRADVRLDAIYSSVGSAGGNQRLFTLLLQGHVHL